MACKLDYWRADNMWAAAGRPDGNLGMETISLQPGQTRVFNTDWKYEKQRNDGTNYYGSHLRIAKNSGDQPIDVRMRITGSEGTVRLAPGQETKVQCDLVHVSCPKT